MPSSHPACSPSDSLAFSYAPYHACDTPRRLLKIYIASHALAIIVILNLLMLLTWHFSTLHIVEKFDVPFVWEAEFVEQQLNRGNIALWSMVFVLVLADLFHALLCTAYYHNYLHPKSTRDETQKQELRGWLRYVFHRAMRKTTQHVKHSDCTMAAKGKDIITSNIQREVQAMALTGRKEPSQTFEIDSQSEGWSITRKSRTYHLLLSALRSSTTRFLLLALWDAFLISILSLHISSFFVNIHPSLAFCGTPATLGYPDWAFVEPSDPVARTLISLGWRKSMSLEDRCLRMNWAIWNAGGFSSVGAAVLASLHLAGMVIRFGEFAAMSWVKKRKRKQAVESQEWQSAPRDVGVKQRARSGTATTTDVVRTISEEEHRVGVRWKREDQGEKSSEKGEPGEEDAANGWAGGFLECLIP